MRSRARWGGARPAPLGGERPLDKSDFPCDDCPRVTVVLIRQSQIIQHEEGSTQWPPSLRSVAADRVRACTRTTGEAFWLLGMLQTIKIGCDDTGGAYGLAEIVVPEGVPARPGTSIAEEDEWFYVLEGEITFWAPTAGKDRWVGVPHDRVRTSRRGERWSASRRCSSRDSSAIGESAPSPRREGHPDIARTRTDRQAKRVRNPRPARPPTRTLSPARPREWVRRGADGPTPELACHQAERGSPAPVDADGIEYEFSEQKFLARLSTPAPAARQRFAANRAFSVGGLRRRAPAPVRLRVARTRADAWRQSALRAP